MDQSLHSRLKLNERTVVGYVRDQALEAGFHRILGGDAVPRIGLELFNAEADTLGLDVDADDLHLHCVANVHDLARMVDAPPGHVGDMQETVDTAKIDKRTVVGDVLDHALDDLPLFEAAHDLAALLGPCLFKYGAARYDDIAAATIHLQDLEGLRRIHQRPHITDGANVDLAAGQEGHGAVEIDGEAALHAIEDLSFNLLVSLVLLFEPGPALLAACLLTRQHGLASGVLNALKIDINLVADSEFGRASGEGKFSEGNAALGLQPYVDNRNVFFD